MCNTSAATCRIYKLKAMCYRNFLFHKTQMLGQSSPPFTSTVAPFMYLKHRILLSFLFFELNRRPWHSHTLTNSHFLTEGTFLFDIKEQPTRPVTFERVDPSDQKHDLTNILTVCDNFVTIMKCFDNFFYIFDNLWQFVSDPCVHEIQSMGPSVSIRQLNWLTDWLTDWVQHLVET